MTSRRAIAFVAAFGLGACVDFPPELQPPATEFEVTLTGQDVWPPVSTTASGTVALRLHFAAIQFTIRVQNLTSADSARLYFGAVQTNGPAVMNLCAPCSVTDGVLASGMVVEPLPGRSYEQIVNMMRTFGAYVQVRDSLGPVLRGQVRNVFP